MCPSNFSAGSHSDPEDRRETVSLVIPVFNEEAIVPHLIREIEQYRRDHAFVTRVIIVDDGSTDGTVPELKRLTTNLEGYSLVSFSRNFGHQIAITAGLYYVETDAAVILDADLQDPLAVVTEMVDHWHHGYDVAYGLRRHRKGESFFKKITAAAFYRFFRLMTDIEMPLDTGDFRLISRPVIEAFKQLGEQRPFVRGLVSWLGFSQVAVPYDREQRAAGTPKYTYRRLLQMALDGLASFSDKPLRLAVRMGLFVSVFAGFGGAVWAVAAKYYFHSAMSGWASLMIVIVFFGGLNLFFMGLVGSYLARVFDQAKDRPRYIVRSEWHSEGHTLPHATRGALEERMEVSEPDQV